MSSSTAAATPGGLKALILVGGFGTRLRPLTLSCAKPLVPFCNLPILEHQIAALVKVGVRKIVLAVSYRPEDMKEFLAEMSAKYSVEIVISLEDIPMNTAGPLAVARAHLDDGSGEPFFVFNSDVTCDYPLQDLLDFHRSHPGAEGTLLITMVQDPSKYGVVAHDEAGLVTAFVEKPTTLMWGNHINAGLYCLSPAILRRIPLAPTSIEKEVFPFVADEKKLFCMRLKGYWMDIGQPKDYVTGVNLHLAYLRSQGSAELAPAGEGIRGNVLIHPTARVAPGALLGPDVVVGPGCTVEQGARLQHSTLLAGSTVRAHAYVDLSIVGWKSTVGMWGRVEGNTVLGEDVQVGDGVLVNGALVLPHKTVRESIHAKGQIIM